MAFECKHGQILYGTTCLNCEREREQITPKITPRAPRKPPRIFDSFRCDAADAAAMAIAPLLPDAQMERLFKLRSDSADAVAMTMALKPQLSPWTIFSICKPWGYGSDAFIEGFFKDDAGFHIFGVDLAQTGRK